MRILDSRQNTITNVCSRNFERIWICIFQVPTVKLVTEKIESDDKDDKAVYQNQKVQFYSREKCFIEDHIAQIVERVVSCFEKRYGNLYLNLEETSINIP